MTRYRNFHSGEAQLQAESGVDTAAFDAGVDQPFQPELNSSEVTFIEKRTFSVAASIDTDGRPWASPLIGAAGALFTVQDATTVQVRPRPIDGDPLFDNVAAVGSMGVLYFNPAIRRRAKSLGTGTIETDGSITYRMHRMFGICPKYIFKRNHDTDEAATHQSAALPTVTAELSAEDRLQLTTSDTMFLASHSEQHGTDPTHRGGPPGFITVVDNTTLSIPDYVGNGMFQTLGNLLLDNRIGLLSIDFATGRTLQVTGRGAVHASDPEDSYSVRTLVIDIEEVRSSQVDVGTWTDVEPFDLQPNLFNPATPRKPGTS